MPIIYNNGSTSSGSVSIPEVYSDPISPTDQSAWILATQITTLGSPMGLLLALTYSVTTFNYQFSYKTLEGPIVRIPLT